MPRAMPAGVGVVGDEGELPLEPGRRIDHILVRCDDHGPVLRVADCRRIFDQPVDGVRASDHFGLLADLTLPTAGG